MARVIFLLSTIFIFSFCAKQTYEIDVICEVDELYNYVVKWDIYPMMEGDVKIYTSLDPDNFSTDHPYKIVPISAGKADLMIKGSLRRRFFLLQFDKDYEVVVGVKNQTFETIFNYRDFGGIKTEKGKTIKWGKLYRSGNLDNASDISARRIAYMGVNTWIDLRLGGMKERMNPLMNIETYRNIPITAHIDADLTRSRLMSGKMTKEDAVNELEKIFITMPSCTESLRKVFKVLEDPNSYPVIISCDYGILQTSVFSTILLHILEVPDYTIIEEFELNNMYFNMDGFAYRYLHLSPQLQDVLTALVVSDKKYIDIMLDNILEKYGSLDNYIRNEIGLNQEDIDKIRANLLQ